MNKFLSVILILILISLSACKPEEALKANIKQNSDLSEDINLKIYENQELGISFKYPSNFKVYQADADRLNIDSGYKNSDSQFNTVSISIERAGMDKLSMQVIESMINPDFSGFAETLKTYSSEEYLTELRRQMEFTKKTDPKSFEAIYGDKTVDEAIDFQLEMLKKQVESMEKKRTYQVLDKGNYELVVVNSEDKYYPHYLLSDKGTFYVGHLAQNPYNFISEEDYNSYKVQFDSLIETIKII